MNLNYYIVFHAEFPRDPEGFGPSGKELGTILCDELRGSGVEVSEVDEEEVACRVECKLTTVTVELTVGAEYLDDRQSQWFIQISRDGPFFRRQEVDEAEVLKLLELLNQILRSSKEVSGVKWYPEFETSDVLLLVPESEGPIPVADFEARLHSTIKFKRQVEQLVSRLTRLGSLATFSFVAMASLAVGPHGTEYLVGVLFVGLLTLILGGNIVPSLMVGVAAKARRDQLDGVS